MTFEVASMLISTVVTVAVLLFVLSVVRKSGNDRVIDPELAKTIIKNAPYYLLDEIQEHHGL